MHYLDVFAEESGDEKLWRKGEAHCFLDPLVLLSGLSPERRQDGEQERSCFYRSSLLTGTRKNVESSMVT